MADGSGLVQGFMLEVVDELDAAARDALVGVYLHGSAVLGDWIPSLSDVDALVVVADSAAPGLAEVARVLAAERSCPGVGLEVSVVEASAARMPEAPWPFVVHVSAAPQDRKTVWGAPGRGDPDLILHYAVAREFGWTACGPRPETVFGEVAVGVIIKQLAVELRWAVEHADASYAVLNACRALRYRNEQVLCSKTDGGNWALAHHIERALVQRALDERSSALHEALTTKAAEWVITVAEDLSH